MLKVFSRPCSSILTSLHLSFICQLKERERKLVKEFNESHKDGVSQEGFVRLVQSCEKEVIFSNVEVDISVYVSSLLLQLLSHMII